MAGYPGNEPHNHSRANNNAMMNCPGCVQLPPLTDLDGKTMNISDVADPAIVDGFLDSSTHPEDDVLQKIRAITQAEGLPAIEVSAQQGKLLELLAKTAKARNTLEIGTLAGYSTVCLARGTSGRVVSLEFEEKHALVAIKNLELANLSHRVDVVLGDAHDTLSQMACAIENGQYKFTFDFIFIDADKESNLKYFQWADRLGSDDVTIVVDNVIRDGRVLDPARADKREFIEYLGTNPNYDVSVVQTVGSKGWDGFVIAKRHFVIED